MIYIFQNSFFHSILVGLEISKVVNPDQEELANDDESLKMDIEKRISNTLFFFFFFFFLYVFSFFDCFVSWLL